MNRKSPSSLSDAEMLARMQGLAKSERAAKAALGAHLAEFKARGLHLEAGCPSLSAYCADVLHLPETPPEDLEPE